MAGIDLDSLLNEISNNPPSSGEAGTSTSLKVQGGSNIDAIAGAITDMGRAIKAQSISQQSALESQKKLSDVAANVDLNAASQAITAGAAEGRITTAAGADALVAQRRKQATFDTAGLESTDPSSTINDAIDAFNISHQRARALADEALRREGMSLGDIFRGAVSVGDYLDAKIVNPPEMYVERARAEQEIAKDAAEQITGLQAAYSGQAAIAESLHPNLTAGVVADKAITAAYVFSKQASEFQLEALTRQSKYYQDVLSNSQFNASNAVAIAKDKIEAENSLRQWAAMSSKTTAPDVAVGYVRVALKAMNVPGAEELSAKLMKETENNPVMKARYNDLVQQGMMLAGAAQTPGQPLPNIYGSAGEAYFTLTSNRGTLPAGSEGVQKLIMESAAGTELDMSNRPVKAGDRVGLINSNIAKWIAANKNDLDSTLAYGKPPIQAIVASAAFGTSEMEPVKALLTPLAASADSVPLAMVTDALVKSDLPNPLVIKGIKTYMDMASGTIDARNKHQLVGLPTSAQLGYSGFVNKDSVFGGKVSLKNTEKSITDYVFKQRFNKGSKGYLIDVLPQ